MLWTVILLACLVVMLASYIWWFHFASNDDLSVSEREIGRLTAKMELLSNRIIDARSSLLNSWMKEHESDCITATGSPLKDCDCGTDHFNAVLNDALQHLTLKIKAQP